MGSSARSSSKNGHSSESGCTKGKCDSVEATLGSEELLLAKKVSIVVSNDFISSIVGSVALVVFVEVPLVNESDSVTGPN